MKDKLYSAMIDGINNAVQSLHGKKGTCCVENCPNDAIAKSFCNAHYIRNKKGLDLKKPVQQKSLSCIDCDEPLNKKGGWMRCAKHFKIARQRAIKESLVDAMGGCCNKCGGVFPLAVYDFHHVGEKNESPSYVIATSSVEKIAEEIEKCVLLCANCHRIHHARELE